MLKSVTTPAHNARTLAHSAQNHCFGCGPGSSVGLHLEFRLESSLNSSSQDGQESASEFPLLVVCDATLGQQYEGPPGYLHGGIIATLLDEAMSKANRASGIIAVTRQIEVNYLRPIPSERAVRIEGWLERRDGRKLFPRARVLAADGTVLASATAVFIEITAASTKPPA